MIKILSGTFFNIGKIISRPIFYFADTAAEEKTKQISADFTDKRVKVQAKQPICKGRAWKSEELRLKSNEDLQKLWYVLVKEKNCMLADQMLRKNSSGRSIRRNGRIEKVEKAMKRIIGVFNERQVIRKNFRYKLEEEYIAKKRSELENSLSGKPQAIQITWDLLRSKYHDLRKGVDNISYLEKMWKKKTDFEERNKNAESRLAKVNPDQKFTSFWSKEIQMGDRPTQEEILRMHVKNWKSLNLKQRKIILGFLNARRAKEAKSAFIEQLKILGQKVALEEAKERILSSNENTTIESSK